MMYADVVMEKSNNILDSDTKIRHKLEEYMDNLKKSKNYKKDTDLDENDLMNLKKNFIVINENKNDKKTPIITKKLNSIFSLNKSFIPRTLAPIKAGIAK